MRKLKLTQHFQAKQLQKTYKAPSRFSILDSAEKKFDANDLLFEKIATFALN
jgi:hypothetical protein